MTVPLPSSTPNVPERRLPSWKTRCRRTWSRIVSTVCLKEVQEIAKETSSRYAGQVVEVLAEEKNHQEEGYLTGRLSNNLLVHFKGDESLIGKLVSVHLTESRGFYYMGELV